MSTLKRLLPHFIANLIFIAVLFGYYYPTLSGKSLAQNDVVQAKGFSKEADEIFAKTGKEVLWTNSSFSGMPIWVGHTSNVLNYIHKTLTAVLPSGILLGWMGFIGFYILMLVLGAQVWLAFAMGAAFVFSSFNIISYEAGHINKVYDMALMAPVLAGVWMVFRQHKYLAGAAVTTFFLGLQVYYGHYQITYYLLFILLFMGLYELVHAIKYKTYKHLLTSVAILFFSAVIAIGPNISKMYTNYVYSKNTIRGGSELTSKKTEGGGLDKEYAMSWSNDVSEVFTVFIPYFYGGASTEDLGQGSNTYKALIDNGIARNEAKEYVKNLPLYWGNQPFTAGPLYFGAIIVFLFVLGMFTIKEKYKWWIFGISVFAFMMSWGKNFDLLTDLLFNYFPLYNKFRSVTMAMSIAQVTVPFLAGLFLVKLMNHEISEEKLMKGLKWSLGICGGFALLFTFFGGAFFTFANENDANYGMPEWMIESLRADRLSKLRTDSFRTLVFVCIAAGLIYAYMKQSVKEVTFLALFAFFIILDLAWVDKRYLNADDFEKHSKNENWVELSEEDEQILLDTSKSYRVLNISKSPFNDATTSYYHKSIGGYSAIKLSRYQDLIENQISKNNMQVFDMLNTKYVIVPDKESGRNFVQKNPTALGNAWFVRSLRKVKNADEEMKALDNFVAKQEAIVDVRFDSLLQNLNMNYDSLATVELVNNEHPDYLVYKTETHSEQVLVFSEVYYQPGWNAYIDGQLVPHFRVNYVLRAMRVPAGVHKIEFKFEPAHYYQSEKVAYFGSWIFVLYILGLFGLMYKTRQQ